MMLHKLPEDRAQSPWAECVVTRNGKMMFAASLRDQTSVRARLPHELVLEGSAQRSFKIVSGKVPR